MYASIDEIIDRTGFTNGDRIRAMTDEELTDFLEAVTDACFERSTPRCPNCPMKIKGSVFCDIDGWLKQPAKED